MIDGATHERGPGASSPPAGPAEGGDPNPAPVGAPLQPEFVELDELDVPEPPTTGDAEVDRALQHVRAAMTRPLADQVRAYDSVHRALQDRLADVED